MGAQEDGTRRKPCATCHGRRRRVVDGAIVTCSTCHGTGTAETSLRLFEPVMEGVA